MFTNKIVHQLDSSSSCFHGWGWLLQSYVFDNDMVAS